MNWLTKRYNKKSAKKNGWHPSWFAPNLTEFDEVLLNEIKKFQTEHDLDVDGLVGPATFRRLSASRELQEESWERSILINGEYCPIDWDVKIDLIKPGAFKKVRSDRKPSMIVTHWDVCTSAAKCKRVLEARDISTHFCIDNDGLIYQFLDTNDIGWHAGIRKVNNVSIGIDFSNAYYVKYNRIYEKRGFPPRPILSGSRVHGVKLKPHLGYYKIQIEAYRRLLKTLCEYYDIPKQVPLAKDGVNLLEGVNQDARKGKFKGIVCHYHLTRKKIDCAGLQLGNIINSLD